MDNTSTLNNLLKLTYSEATENERLILKNKLINSEDLRREFKHMCDVKSLLDQEFYAPNPTSIQIILEESQKNELETYLD
ncbi:MAG: hypothetical protein JJ975_15595 [Bacteroidia bacterium]|nr:hypothetical protein [Bacteroidia bacterium]